LVIKQKVEIGTCFSFSPHSPARRGGPLATVFAEYAAQGVEFTRGLGNMSWHKREFVVKDCDGRLLAFGANL